MQTQSTDPHFFLKIFWLLFWPKKHHQKYWKFLQVNDINVFKNWYYSIPIHFISVSIFLNNMPMFSSIWSPTWSQSGVSDHRHDCNCSIDFDHFDILASDANKLRLLIKGSLSIKLDQPQLNKTIMSFPLKLFDWNIW